MSSPNALKQTSVAWLDANRSRLSEFNQTIFSFSEPAWREYQSSAAYVDLLRSEGFEVEAGSAGMPTAFCATWGSGRPVLACWAEYDMVPGQNQIGVPYRAVRPGLHPAAPGDPDPHSALGTATLAAMLATKEAMAVHKVQGTLRYFGEPAEKMCGGKAIHAAKGYYDDLDAALGYHPEFANTVQWRIQSAPYSSCVFIFECPDIAPKLDAEFHALDEPQIAPRAPGALDAIFFMYSMTKATKERVLPNVGGWSISENVLVASQATADNLASPIGQIQFAWRSPDLGSDQRIYEQLAANARHAAAASGCTVSVRWVSRIRPGLFNEALAMLTYDNLLAVGPPKRGMAAVEFAREIERAMGCEASLQPFAEEGLRVDHPVSRDAEWGRQLPPWQTHFTWDDYVEYTWHAPTARLFTAKPVLQRARSWSHWSGYALNGFPAAIDPTWETGASILSGTLIDLLCRPEFLLAARAEFEERTGGGIGGKSWIPPRHSADIVPPVDLRWPEYVMTTRGREWCLPTPMARGEPL